MTQQVLIDPILNLIDQQESMLAITVPGAFPVDRSVQTIIQSKVDLLADWHIPSYLHSLRLVPWAEQIARIMGCNPMEIRDIAYAALLHDIGKTAVPLEILDKPGPLDDEQWAIMRGHPTAGAKLVEKLPQLDAVYEMILHHHEKIDGTGYPSRLTGSQISLGARIITLVDSFGAMTEPRLYSRTLTHAEAINEVRRCAGTHFDPTITNVFIEQVLPRNSFIPITN